MPQDPNERRPANMSSEQYRKMQAAREKRRKQRRKQKILVLGAMVVAAVLLVLCIVLLVKSIFGGKDDSTSSKKQSSSTASVASLPIGGDANITWPTADDKTAWNLMLVNEQNLAPDGFEPELETVVQQTEEGAVPYYFDARIKDSLERMMADCNAVEGHDLRIVSGFRSYDRQEKLYKHYVDDYISRGDDEETARQKAKQITSVPGASDHHTGLAVDFVKGATTETSSDFSNTSEYQWLVENAASYGFILRYTGEKAAITGVPYKPWHWRYVGEEDAAAIKNAGICLEEYLSALPAGTSGSAGQGDDGASSSEPEGAVSKPDGTDSASGTQEPDSGASSGG